MAQYYPIVVQAGNNLAGDSLGFHAYSLRIDNCTNQWYLEETSLAYIPPYSLGVCLRLYGTGVAILLCSAPVGQPQLAKITGEQLVGVYSDQLRTEVAPSPIRQFTLVQSVSDLTQGPQPASPPVGITRMWAAPNGDLHYLLPNNTDALLLSSTNYASYVGNFNVGGDLAGTVSNAAVWLRDTSYIYGLDTHGTNTRILGRASSDGTYLFAGTNGLLYFWSDTPSVQLGNWNGGSNLLTVSGMVAVGNGAPAQAGDIAVARVTAPSTGIIYLGNSNTRYLYWDGTYYQMPGTINTSGLVVNGPARATTSGYLGQYASATSWTSTTYNTWLATPITFSFTIPAGTSTNIIVSYSTGVANANQGGLIYSAMAVDGAVGNYQVINAPVANQIIQVTGIAAITGLGIGTHTLTLYLQANSGVFAISSGAQSFLTAFELLA